MSYSQGKSWLPRMRFLFVMAGVVMPAVGGRGGGLLLSARLFLVYATCGTVAERILRSRPPGNKRAFAMRPYTTAGRLGARG